MHMFSVFAFVCNSLMMKSTEKISNWNKIMNEQTAQTQPPPHSPHYHYQQPVHSVAVVHNTAHCLFHTVTRSHTQGTVCWQSAGQFCKLEKCWNFSENQTKTRDLRPTKSRWCSCHVTNFWTTCGFIHKRFKKISNSANPSCWSAPVMFWLQVTAHRQ